MQFDSYIFQAADVKKLFNNKFIVVIGDSVMRSIYKDVVLLLQEDRMLYTCELRKRGELTFLNDELIEGGEKMEMTNSKSYREVRQYLCPQHLVRFYFVTRIYSSYVETILADLMTGHPPDVIIVNSCLWDISRYGSSSMTAYKENLQRFCASMKRLLKESTLLVWTTTMPVAQSIRGGFLVDQVSFLSDVLRVDLLMANFYAHQVLTAHGFDVLDLHHAFRRQTDKRAADGVHWNAIVHRAITNMLLEHVCESWNVTIPKVPNSSFSKDTPKNTELGQNGMLSSHRGFKREFGRPLSNAQLNSRSYCFSDDQNVGLFSGGMADWSTSFNDYGSNENSFNFENYQNANSRSCNFSNLENFIMNSCNQFGFGGSRSDFNGRYDNFRGFGNNVLSQGGNNFYFNDDQLVDFSLTRPVNTVGRGSNYMHRGARHRPYWWF